MVETNGRKHLIAVAVLFALVFSALLAGCQGGAAEPAKPGDQVIKEGIAKLTELTSYSYEAAFKGDLKDEEGTQIKFDLNLGGQVDVKDPKDPKVTLKLAGSGSDGKDMGGDGSLELRLNKEALYFNVIKLNLLSGAGEVPKEVTDMFGKWWKITLPEGATDEIASSVPQGEDANLSPEQLKVKKAMEETNFFSTPKFVGTENVKGEDSYHYSVTLDKKAFLEFMKKAGEAQGQPVSDSDMADAEKGFEKVDVTGDVYVGITSGILNKFSGSIKMSGTEKDEPSGTVVVGLTVWDANKPVTLEAPAGATEFPVEEFLGPLLMGGMGGGVEGLEDPSSFDETDFSEFDMDLDPSFDMQ